MANRNSQYYLGLTIGPVTKTLMMAERTRHLWAASYTFSYLMKEIAKAFYAKHPDRTWLKPGAGEGFFEAFKAAKDRKNPVFSTTGAGIFPDHMILSSPVQDDVDEIKDIAKEVILDFAGKVAKEIKKTSEVEEIKSDFLQFFQVYIVRKQVQDGENPILVLSETLNTIELQKQVAPEKSKFLFAFFDVVPGSFLAEDAFGGRHKFKSIPEIGLNIHLESKKRDSAGKTCEEFVGPKVDAAEKKAKEEGKKKSEADERYHDWVKEFIKGYNEDHKDDPMTFFTAHKYVAIVQSDGDNIGTLLNKLPPDKLPEFSKVLTEFAAEAAELVQKYEGMPVYFGGDDALFFAPVVNGDKNIFQLLAALNEAFSGRFEAYNAVQPNLPTLSFGLSITFSKFPMYEALKQAHFLLFDVAKRGIESDETYPETGKKKRIKNNVAFRVLRHSGSAFGGMIHLDQTKSFSLMEDFRTILEMNLDTPQEALRSIIYRIPDNPELFKLIGKDKEKLMNFLDNSFDEDIHRDVRSKLNKKERSYFDAVANLIHNVYENSDRFEEKTWDEAFESAGRMAYSLLKTIVFLTTTEN